ncbi:bifunctional peptidase and arginyl-hydroxylase JMJD5 isoform X1 [Stomoxys calcitrans]|uniref:bifunctional peptidase and arginyl-hydroxylase JMJD5 isoform X1 n=1 Tax=Stomoxys calcitrans TaxID=35570 RepID=UPI0027E2A596|nr:bifunctional peptidase and arginyl-hydroxylase JMJD5 isoform X1 [Stomoxys calcitrans]
MDTITKLTKFLPSFEEIQDILNDNPTAKYMLKKTLESLAAYNNKNNKHINTSELEECSFLVQALVDKTWEEIHTGNFSLVPINVRKTYALACYCRIVFLLIESMEKPQLEKCSEMLDEAMLLGYTPNIFENCRTFTDTLMEMFDSELDPTLELKLPILERMPRIAAKCDILQLDSPSVQEFNEKCFTAQMPALLLNTINHWPALDKWLNLNYILKLAGNRTVPIEIGSNYATDEWSQQLMKIKDFLKRQFPLEDVDPKDVEYLAQHELFEQIPQLKIDFTTPDYCSLGEHIENVDIKAWLGPKGTVSPMHYDPKHNILCQVFGSKRIILASPQDTEYLYPHESEFLSNTSQINAAALNMDEYPLLSRAKFYHLKLQPGDCLYLPPKWWHYVESESPSFSVSFWWE